MKIYHNIVFMQGDDAAEALQILDDKGERAALNHLAQWDYGTENEHSPETEEPWGSSDSTYKNGAYIMSYNTRLGYIGLTRTQRVNSAQFEAERNALKVALRSRAKESHQLPPQYRA
jgi:hypothetical protein